MRIEKFGDKAIGVTLTGNPKNQEKEAFRICFPWGHVEVTRAVDGKPRQETDYWVHLFVNHPQSINFCPDKDCGEYAGAGAIKDARLDQTDRHTSETDVGDFQRSQLYHVALRVGPKENEK